MCVSKTDMNMHLKNSKLVKIVNNLDIADVSILEKGNYHFLMKLIFYDTLNLSGIEYIYFLLTIAIKNNTRIDTPMKGTTMSVKALSSDILCSKNS